MSNHRPARSRVRFLVCLLASAALGGLSPFAGTFPAAAQQKRGQQKSASQKDGSQPDAQPKGQTQKASKVTPDLEMDFSSAPTYVKANSLTLLAEQRTFAYVGDVEVRQGDMVLTTARLDGRYSDKNEIQALTATGDVFITKGSEVRARGEKAIYDKTTESLVLTDSPELQREKSVLTADKITIFLKENRSVAEGKVRMKLTKPEGKNDRNMMPLGR